MSQDIRLEHIATIDDPITWSEGMLLTPQHLQQSDIFWEKQMLHQMQQMQPYYWGIIELALHSDKLSSGEVSIESIRAIMRDGLVVQDGKKYRNDKKNAPVNAIAPINLEEHHDFEKKHWTSVYLKVPTRVGGAAAETAAVRRYDTVSGDVEIDDTNTDRRVPVDRMLALAELHVGDEPNNNYESIPLFNVKKSNGNYEITYYLPPMLRANSSSFMVEKSLHVHLNNLIKKIRNRARYFSKTQSIPMHKLQAFTVALPHLEAVIETGNSHPFDVFKALTLMYGHLYTLQPSPLPQSLPPYNHNNIGHSLLAVIKRMHVIINQIALSYKMYPFSQKKDNYSLYIPIDWPVECMVIEVVPAAGQSFQAIEEWMHRSRIGSDSLLESLKKKRSPGARYRKLSNEERTIYTQRSDAQFYELQNIMLSMDNGKSGVIKASESLILSGDTDLDPPKSIIYYKPVTA